MPVSINNRLWLFREVCTGLRTSMLHCKAVNPNKAHFEEQRGSRPLLAGGGMGAPPSFRRDDTAGRGGGLCRRMTTASPNRGGPRGRSPRPAAGGLPGRGAGSGSGAGPAGGEAAGTGGGGRGPARVRHAVSCGAAVLRGDSWAAWRRGGPRGEP